MREHKINENIHVDARSDDRSDIAPGRLYQLSEPTVSCDEPFLGQDLWRQLKRVQIPEFAGDKRTYQSWKAAFLACIDSAPATGEYKLLQLRQYLSGEALKTIENLGQSAFAY